MKKRLPKIAFGFVAKASGIPNLVLINEVAKVVDFIEYWLEPFQV